VAQEDDAGKVILAEHPTGPLVSSDSPNGAIGMNSGHNQPNTIEVNCAFLERITVLAASGEPVRCGGARPFMVLVPDYMMDQADSLVADAVETARFEAVDIQDPPVEPPDAPKVVAIRSGQEVFNFGGTFDNRFAKQLDPVIYVMPLGTGSWLSPDTVLSMATGGTVMFTDPASVAEAVATEPFGGWIMSIDYRSDLAEEAIAEAEYRLRLVWLGAGIGAAVLILTDLILAWGYCLRNRQVLFARHVHGWRLARVDGAFVAGTLLLGAAALWLYWRLAEVSVPIGIGAAAVLVNACLAWAFLRLWDRKTRGQDVKRY
jgi:hypothetical protein